MKTFTFVGLLFLCLAGLKYRNTASVYLNHIHKTNDTVFLFKERDTSYYHIVYIEKNRQSRWYKNLLDFKMHYGDSDEYQANLRGLTKTFHSFKKYQFKGLPQEWLPIYGYKGKYYIYYPSEWGLVGRQVFTDSTLVEWTIEGPGPFAIISKKRLDRNTWSIKTYCPYCHGMEQHELIKIHILNNSSGLALWEYPRERGLYRYQLYVPRANAAKFDMVVNYCEQNKTEEFMFDNINYKALLKCHN